MNVSRHDLAATLVAAIRDLLIEGRRIDVPGLGTFAVRHVPSRVETADDGIQVMVPPRDLVEFSPGPEKP